MEWLKETGSPFAGYTPSELIEHQKQDKGYEILDEIQDYIRTKNDLRHGSKQQLYYTMRSFFSHNRAELPKDRGFRIRAEVPPVKSKLDTNIIRQVILSSNKVYRAIFITMFQAGMDQQRFVEWNLKGYPELIESLKKNEYPIKIDFSGRKQYRNIKPYFSFIGDDAIEAINAYIRDERSKLEISPEHENAIFFNQNETPVQNKKVMYNYWLRHLDTIGVIDREAEQGGAGTRYGYGLHEMRDVFRTQWEKSPAKASVAEHCMGHVGDPLGYEKASSDPTWARQEYLKSLPLLNILSNPLNEEMEVQLTQLAQRNIKMQKELDETKHEMNAQLREMWKTLEIAVNKIPVQAEDSIKFGANSLPFLETENDFWYINPEKGLVRMTNTRSFDKAIQSWKDEYGDMFQAEYKEGLDYETVQNLLKTTEPNEIYKKYPELFKSKKAME
jgi:hypothetical protein